MRHVQELHKRIEKNHPSDVYSMNESAIFYRAVPRTFVCLNRAPAQKQDKARVTMTINSNASRTDKLPLLILGKLA